MTMEPLCVGERMKQEYKEYHVLLMSYLKVTFNVSRLDILHKTITISYTVCYCLNENFYPNFSATLGVICAEPHFVTSAVLVFQHI